ncbi:Kdo hydroxylase family protein [Legionella quinlivanii]|uniref:Kdo hydroxylase family protein n=1 Tax=Legionella quinlivanii TaxID=45073 RepID=UPI002244F22F|nr:Kdo hydroxylase family protein [Legionella quinlivanii]MCW8451345.1 Kdo hydroxylase family protein [Legionella quinlivanii]
MDEPLYILNSNSLDKINEVQKDLALNLLESGQVLYFPEYFYAHNAQQEHYLLTDKILDGQHKNISYDYLKDRLGGYNSKNQGLPSILKPFMRQYAEFAKHLLDTVCPLYAEHLIWGRTSYRPAEIRGRASSKRKDDTRVHVDSFPASPVNGRRILRVFCNINPYGEPRVWQLGEAFNQVLERFSPAIPKYNPSVAKLFKWLKVTKTMRSAYDHYQLQLHDRMKLDDHYQQTVSKNTINFQAQSTWVVFTDHVSHAALSGQFLLEQTFYLPVAAMRNPEHSPLRCWEKNKMKELVQA